MEKNTICAGKSILSLEKKSVSGSFVEREGETYYRIANPDGLAPFFMSIVSDSDHWMFVSSNGALTAGRKNPDGALFPYYTDDKIHDSVDLTGSKTLVVVERGEACYLWEPFSERYQGLYSIERSLCKNTSANKIRFEELNHDLDLTFWY